MNLLYIAYSDCNGYIYPGVKKKIEEQVDCFKENGFKMNLITPRFESRLKRLIPFQTSSINWNTMDVAEDIEGLYIRYELSDFQFIRFLKRQKRKKPNMKIVIEIPTFPYDKENINNYKKIRDEIYRERLYLYVDRIVLFSDSYKNLFNIKVINTVNGITCSKMKLKEMRESGNEYHFCFVGGLGWWQGIDRILEGIARYNQKFSERIVFHLVGYDGSEIQEKWKKMCNNLGIIKNVVFEGSLSGDKLDAVYDKCQFAIAGLGDHRKGISVSSSLKSREYLARGIPFAYSGKIDVLEKEPVDFALKLPENESAADIKEIIDFYETIEEKYKNNLPIVMRNYAERMVDMSIAMQPVMEFYKGDKRSASD